MANSTSVQRTRVLLMATSMRGGGSEHQVVLLARHLPRDLFEVHLYLTERSGALLGQLPADVQVHAPRPDQLVGGACWHRWAARLPGTLLRRQAFFLASVVREHRIDVIYDRAFPNTMLAGHPAVRQRIQARRVSTIVSPPHLALPMVEKRFVAAKRRLLSQAYRRSDAVIAVSEAAADSAAAYYGLRRERIVVIPNPIDLQAVRDSVDGSLQRDSAEGDSFPGDRQPRFRLVCVGRMTAEKGQADLIAAIGLLAERLPASGPRLSVRFVGDGPDRMKLQQQWADMAGSAGHVDGHTVEFVGLVSPATGEIAAADGLVLPSHFEGLPNVVLEAFALGTAVVATRSEGTLQLQGKGDDPTCFWADPDSPASLAAALAALLDDPLGRSRHVRAGRRLVEQEHTMAAAIGQITPILLG